MIVNFESNPKNSIIYSSSIMLKYFKKRKSNINLEDLYSFCISKNMEYSIFILTIDWLFLIKIINRIDEKNEVVLCDY